MNAKVNHGLEQFQLFKRTIKRRKLEKAFRDESHDDRMSVKNTLLSISYDSPFSQIRYTYSTTDNLPLKREMVI